MSMRESLQEPLPEGRPLLEQERMSFTGALFTAVKGFIGAAILAMPYAAKLSGLLGLAFGLIVVTAAVNLTLKYLVVTKRHILVRRSSLGGSLDLPYPELAFEVGGPWMRYLVIGSLCIAQMGCCIAYQIFVARSITGFLNELDIDAPPHWMLVGLCSPVFVLLCLWAQVSINNLAPVASAGLFIQLIALFGVVVILFIHRCIGDATECGKIDMLHVDTLAITMGIAAFAMEGVFPVLPIEHAMENPAQFHHVIDFSTIGAGLLCFLFAWAGYSIFGDATEAVFSLNIHGIVGHIVKGSISIALIAGFPVQLYPIIQWVDGLIEAHYEGASNISLFQRLGVLGLCTITTVCAAIFPHFGNVLSIVGCVGFSVGGIVLPPLLYWKCFNHADIHLQDKILLPCIVFAGLAILTMGLYSNLIAVSHGNGSAHHSAHHPH